MKKIHHVLLLLISLVSINTWAATEEPQQMLEDIASRMVSFLEKHSHELESNEQLAKDTVIKELLPFIDKQGLGRRVLAKNVWNDATVAQKQLFIEKFVNLIINTYASGLAKFNGQRFKFTDTRFSRDGKTVWVKSHMEQNNGAPIRIDYVLKKPRGINEWRVVDVAIEGVSMVLSYRSQFKRQINEVGFEGVLDKLVKNEIKLEQRLKKP
ncbi:phospholipid-binding protein MlaC [Pleionea sp. CnH1-48]|uniref:MlaC/ttg2D family ABC transporter substrate-binding protein n=1 Tax=Pleionea sp. CnH1-48 TaxID=2954494 RepID=UPI0020981362|nr:ABC transporter substrate-binding protein [Pleionea sp. CnH1-48]MCO7222752.1 ABC transporter substrate-binding protein [Pleionea sp. CnH1-48]